MATKTHTQVLHSSASDEWGTPPDLFAELDRRFGPFTLDACASNGMAKVRRRYGLDHPDPSWRNALARDWAADAGRGAVWCNPPYSRELFPEFLRKADETARAGTRVVMLFPSVKSGTKAFQEHVVPHLAAGSGQVVFWPGRVRFITPTGQTGPAPSPSLVVVLG